MSRRAAHTLHAHHVPHIWRASSGARQLPAASCRRRWRRARNRGNGPNVAWQMPLFGMDPLRPAPAPFRVFVFRALIAFRRASPPVPRRLTAVTGRSLTSFIYIYLYIYIYIYRYIYTPIHLLFIHSIMPPTFSSMFITSLNIPNESHLMRLSRIRRLLAL